MPVTLTIKNVPDELAARLRALAAKHHRSLQGELMSIVESAGESHEPRQSGAGAESTRRSSEAEAMDAPASDDLLGEIDALVAGSAWGEAPLLARAQANSREIARAPGLSLHEPEAPPYRL